MVLRSPLGAIPSDCKGDQNESEAKCCYDCQFWCGRCKKGRINSIAQDPACKNYRPRYHTQKFLIEINSNGLKPVSKIDLVLCLKHLPIACSSASFRVIDQEDRQ